MSTARTTHESAVWAASSHRMAATLMAEYLRAALRRPVVAGPPVEPHPARVTLLMAEHEDSRTLPRTLRALSSGSSRVILRYDGAERSADILETADRFGVWATVDARDDVRGLVELVRRGLTRSSASSGFHTTALAGWHHATDPEASALTEREKAVVRLLCGDTPLDTAAAARRLGISVNTVNVHLRNIRRKLRDRYTGNRQALRDALADAGWLEC